ncbi:hypothetical protein [Cyclobacterium jeungdonense]|uniref:Uncharacterized protein n=1 Tax=Cyclobacterium jeungdonense TaxID=708087 RepID=A0ABT8C3I5_9BACT|nr:hypothetical protein [Cyclobacterium jeungdonense]MDN3686609.1 hypothetical protein [Cyclobacterium jeungdonense]
MNNLLERHKITLVFYITIIFLFASMVFARLVREPYPSLNMPSFTRSGINEGIVPASYFEIIYLNNGEEVWKGNLREIFDEVPVTLYINNMRFIFFNKAGLNLEESRNQKQKIISAIPGGIKIHEVLKQWTTNDVIGGANEVIPELMLKKKPFKSENVTDFIVNEYVEYYHLVEGFQYREIVRHKKFTFD